MRRRKNKGWTLKSKLIGLYFFISVIPIILVSIIAYFTYYDSILEQSLALVDQNAKQHEIVINERLKNYQSFMFDMVIDSQIIDLSKQLSTLGDENENLIVKGSSDESSSKASW
ncbi:MAG: hypothetical protein FWE25_03975 [Lachnospiraceae bacterium]|nr:hypothetical protein [Lachnospiraceae bacterium]